MPKIVDHGERREEVVEAARRIILRDGIDAATTRAIAREAGYSNGVLTHYFADKDDILVSALEASHRRIAERLRARLAGLTGLAALREVLLDNVPLDEERRGETGLEVGFWGRSLTDPALLEVQRREAAELRYLVVSLLRSAAEAGEVRTGGRLDEDLDDVAERLLALVDGLSVHRLLYPGRVPDDRLERLILAELDRLTA
ncbi:TetR family transcriptional regulator C-terminal domain-containing protein [Microbispora sp. RL4-1S]|uniref:TetR family transcriptional regulator C-terminal domain-containing protein n=1 Tax=Microbispora oryzae TaxID=2806554 RepID=A0A940WN33_9ACTN|nr:TetR family transcriptional regulator C-terminal domain-containing protein [Microbispora oryzae]MBP2703674.1 TetR family transcriptional regulator C-terminal domain-containing protein [Microbispora oryzae]